MISVLEEVQREINHLRQTNPIKKKVEAFGFEVRKIESYQHSMYAGLEGYVIDVTLDTICLQPNEIKSLMQIRGFMWISVWSGRLQVSYWRKEEEN